MASSTSPLHSDGKTGLKIRVRFFNAPRPIVRTHSTVICSEDQRNSSVAETSIEVSTPHHNLDPEPIEASSSHTQLEISSMPLQNTTPNTPYLPSPPESAIPPRPVPAARTVNLKVEIPRLPVKTKEQHRIAKIRKAASKRWRGKLQRSFPNQNKIKNAYPGKLLRHYTNTDSNPEEGDHVKSTEDESKVVRPPVTESARVENLLRNFPILGTETTQAVRPIVLARDKSPQKDERDVPMVPRTLAQEQYLHMQRHALKQNMAATSSEAAKESARKNFGWSEEDEDDDDDETGRVAMMMSGL